MKRFERTLPGGATPIHDPVPVTRMVDTAKVYVRVDPNGRLCISDHAGAARRVPVSVARVGSGYFEAWGKANDR